MTASPRLVFLADDTDADDLDHVCGLLSDADVFAERCHPRELAFVGGPDGLTPYRGGACFAPQLVVGWVYEDWLAPGMAQLESLQAAGVCVLNDGQTLFRGQNKSLMTALLHAAGVPHGHTWVTWDSGLGADRPHDGDFPVVVKPGLTISAGHTVLASGGGVARLHSRTEWNSVRSILDNLGQPLYAQSFVPSAAARGDVRVWVFDFRAVAAITKIPEPGEWITNVTSGRARQEARTLTSELLRVSERAARAIGAPIAGVDLAEDGDSYTVFEVNTCPTFLPSREILGDLVPSALANLLLRVVREGASR